MSRRRANSGAMRTAASPYPAIISAICISENTRSEPHLGTRAQQIGSAARWIIEATSSCHQNTAVSRCVSTSAAP
ncbi:MAG: hypothetical protein ACREOC_07675 [Gemmatimonadales bacterium]